MNYNEYKPSKVLEPYVKCYYTLAYDEQTVVADYAFATGCMEVMFTLEGNPWQVKVKDSMVTTSPVQLWGQILQPLPFKTSGRNEVFGIRFYPTTPVFWLKENINAFNDGVSNLTDVLGVDVMNLAEQLQEAKSVITRIDLVEAYLQRHLRTNPKVTDRTALVSQVMREITQPDFFDNIENVAERYGITSRYLQKIFVQHTGLSPKLYAKIHRFQNSLILLGKPDVSLTSIAYTCGYFDQSHFIREFKSFTGLSPSAFSPTTSTAILASPNK